VEAAVVYYYVMPHGKPDFTKVRAAPVLGHFGTGDDFVSLSAAQSLEQEMRDAGVDANFEYYEGKGHAFFNDTNRMGTYDERAAQQSWQKTLDFLRAHLA
jgi:carboxymethylenebutenolidase